MGHGRSSRWGHSHELSKNLSHFWEKLLLFWLISCFFIATCGPVDWWRNPPDPSGQVRSLRVSEHHPKRVGVLDSDLVPGFLWQKVAPNSMGFIMAKHQHFPIFQWPCDFMKNGYEKWVSPSADPICQKWDETAMNSSRGSRIPAKVSWIFTSTCCGYSRCGRIRPAAIVEMAPSKNGKHHVKCIFGWAHIVIQWETMGF